MVLDQAVIHRFVAVNAEALEKKSISSVSAALAGEVPGVNVVNTNGQPGSRSDIYVRGVGSVNASTAPLISWTGTL